MSQAGSESLRASFRNFRHPNWMPDQKPRARGRNLSPEFVSSAVPQGRGWAGRFWLHPGGSRAAHPAQGAEPHTHPSHCCIPNPCKVPTSSSQLSPISPVQICPGCVHLQHPSRAMRQWEAGLGLFSCLWVPIMTNPDPPRHELPQLREIPAFWDLPLPTGMQGKVLTAQEGMRGRQEEAGGVWMEFWGGQASAPFHSFEDFALNLQSRLLLPAELSCHQNRNFGLKTCHLQAEAPPGKH